MLYAGRRLCVGRTDDRERGTQAVTSALHRKSEVVEDDGARFAVRTAPGAPIPSYDENDLDQADDVVFTAAESSQAWALSRPR